jgi:hypothetical protein
MADDCFNAGATASVVGYKGSSRISRELELLFGLTPLEEAKQTLARLVSD